MIKYRRQVIFPGQYVITSVPSLISTVLGSCVSICLWCRETHTGGMNHYLLPGNADDDPGNSNRGVTSIRLLIRSLINRKISVENLEAKVFGGCNSLYKKNDYFKVGERNIAIAMETLREHNVKVAAKHVGGSCGRKIVFNTASGRVRMRLIIKTTDINEEINKGFGY